MYKRFFDSLKCQTFACKDLKKPSFLPFKAVLTVLKENITVAGCDEKSCDHQHTGIILRSAMLQLALSNMWEAQA